MARLLKVPWHEAFLKCASPHTEAPDRFLRWGAFSVLGAVLKRRVYYKDGLYTLYPNQYVVLVSPPGIGKGTAIQFAWGLIRDGGANPLANMISDRVTAPKIIDRIANGWNGAPSIGAGGQMLMPVKDHACTIFSSELQNLITASDWMLSFMCDAWDRNEYEYDTKNSGSAFVKDMACSLIGATVPEFAQSVDITSGGFSSRCLFVFEEKESKHLPFPTPVSKAAGSLYDELRLDLHHISTLSGEFQFSAEAKIKFSDHLRKVRANAQYDSGAIAGFRARMRAHLIKLSMIIHLSWSDTLEIAGIDMDNAISYINGVMGDVDRIFRGSGESDLIAAAAKVQSFLEKVGAASKKDILKNLVRDMSPEMLDRSLYTLETIGWLTTTAQGKTTMYRKV